RLDVRRHVDLRHAHGRHLAAEPVEDAHRGGLYVSPFRTRGVKCRMLDHLLQDLHSAARSVVKYPIAAAVAVISLAGGIGATTATLVIRDVVFHRPPPLYRHPEQISRVQVGSPERPIVPAGNAVPGPLFAMWRDAVPG